MSVVVKGEEERGQDGGLPRWTDMESVRLCFSVNINYNDNIDLFYRHSKVEPLNVDLKKMISIFGIVMFWECLKVESATKIGVLYWR